MSIFKRILGKDKPRAPEHHALLMVMLPDGEAFSAKATFEYLTSHWTDLPSIVGHDVQEVASTANIPGGIVALGHMPVPIPPGDLTGPTAVAWHWPDATMAVASHRSHVIVHARSSALDAIDVKLVATKLAASVVAVADGVGVYVGDAMLVRSGADFRSDAESASRESLPILSWIGFNLVGEEQGVSAYTTGLSSFGLLELEVLRSTWPPADVVSRLVDLVNYQLSTGNVIRDGDTFGENESDRTVVRNRAATFIPGSTVAGVEFS
jgi:uncharacterized protein DUF4261